MTKSVPVVVFAVNPFIYEGYKVAKNKSALYRAMKSLGMNYKFTVCAQPLKGEMFTVKSFFGKMPNGDDEQISAIRKRFMNSSKFQSVNYTFKKQRKSLSVWS